MIDGLFEFVVSALAALAAVPLGFFFPCNPCCGGCGVADGKPRTDPANEGTWVPSGTWRGVGGVTWTFVANPGDDSGETWFFFGSESTSKVGGGATVAERQDWGNICNWYSNKTTSPSIISGLSGALNKRATRLPPETAVVHAYTSVSTVNAGPQVLENIYFWRDSDLLTNSEITSTASAHDSTGGAVFTSNAGFLTVCLGTINGGATFNFNSGNFGPGQVNGGATFNFNARNTDSGGHSGTVNDGAVFNDTSQNRNSDVNGGAVFNDTAENFGTVNDGATFNNDANNGNTSTVNGGATFNDDANNFGTVNDGATFNDTAATVGTVNDGATFNDTAANVGTVNDGATFNNDANNGNASTVNGGATFNNSSENFGTVNGGATFNDAARNVSGGTVNGGATFNDAACSSRVIGNFFDTPCTRKFVAHPTDLPVCNGTAPDGCANSADTCGCG